MSRATEILKNNGIEAENVIYPTFMVQILSLFAANAAELVNEHNLALLRAECEKGKMPMDLFDKIIAEDQSSERVSKTLLVSSVIGLIDGQQAATILLAHVAWRETRDAVWAEPTKAELIRLISTINFKDQAAERIVTVGRYTLHQKDGWFKIDESKADLHSGVQ